MFFVFVPEQFLNGFEIPRYCREGGNIPVEGCSKSFGAFTSATYYLYTFGKLTAIKRSIDPRARYQSLVFSALHNLPILDHTDQVRVADGTQAMGDDNGCAGVQQVPQRFLDQAFCHAVDIRGGVIQNQDVYKNCLS
jgi:hypothetical protein